jgi:hypothetical protein
MISGGITYYTTSNQVSSQIATASLSHAKDISAAVHDSLNDLFNANDPGRVKTTLAGLYFLGASKDERKQIIETAGSAGTPQIRAAISYVLTVDRTYGPAIAADPDVVQIVVSANAHPNANGPTPLPHTVNDPHKPRASGDVLDQTISLLNGTGWVYLGLGPVKEPLTVDHDYSIKNVGPVLSGHAVTFVRTINFREDAPDVAGLATNIGTIKSGQTAVVLSTKDYGLRSGVRAVWGEIFLCAAPSSVPRPAAAKACPQAAPASM